MKDIKTITVSIPAYNEEKNIGALLKSVLSQKESNFQLQKILVISDGSKDKTVEMAKRIKDRRVEVIAKKKREGKVRALNYAFRRNTSDILVQLDADVLPQNANTLVELVKPFHTDRADIVYGDQIPYMPSSYIGKLAHFGFYAWDEAKKTVNAERYNVFGCITAFSRKFLSKYRLPELKYFTEDTYSFYYAKKNNMKTYFQKSAGVMFHLPETIKDYTRQMNRYLTTRHDMEQYFGRELVVKYETVTTRVKLIGLARYSLTQPLHYTAGYVLLHIIPKTRATFFAEKPLWERIDSTK